MKVNETIKEEYLTQDYNNPKYIFHGSNKLLSVLIPHKGVDVAKNKLNEQTAIYGCSAFEGAIPYAIKGKGKYDCQIGYRPGDFKMIISKGVVPEDESGYIYVCDATEFSRCGDTCQYVSHKEVVPLEIIKVYYKDFKECFVYESNLKLSK